VRRVGPRFDGALEVIFQPDDFPAKRGEVLYIHTHPASVLKSAAFDPFTRGADDHFQSALLSCPPNIRGFAAQSSFIEVSLRHSGYYILHVLIGYAKIILYELITERTEKWATPTYLLVIGVTEQ
jgi:hypothetical protein